MIGDLYAIFNFNKMVVLVVYPPNGHVSTIRLTNRPNPTNPICQSHSPIRPHDSLADRDVV